MATLSVAGKNRSVYQVERTALSSCDSMQWNVCNHEKEHGMLSVEQMQDMLLSNKSWGQVIVQVAC